MSFFPDPPPSSPRYCWYLECGARRVHHERQDVMRGRQLVNVPHTVPETAPVYCSLTCAISDGWSTLKYETPEEQQARRKLWLETRGDDLL